MFSDRLFGEGLPTWAIFTELALCGAFIFVFGARLTRLADRIGDVLNLGKAWVGLLLLAGITSLPEVVTGATSVFINQPDLAFGNIFGSCMFNVAIIVILDGLMRTGSILREAHVSHSLSSSLSIVLLVLAVLGMRLVDQMAGAETDSLISASMFELGYCILIAATYLACMYLNYRFEQQHCVDGQMALPQTVPPRDQGLFVKFALVAVVIVVLTMWLTKTANVLQDHPIEWLGGRKLGATFVGVFFLAAATSLPEIATSITAVKIGHLDLALGNIFGSNMFNIFIIPILKVFSLIKGDGLLMQATIFSVQSHTITGLFAILISGVAVAGLIYRTKRRVFHFGFDSIIIGIIYLVGMYVLTG